MVYKKSHSILPHKCIFLATLTFSKFGHVFRSIAASNRAFIIFDDHFAFSTPVEEPSKHFFGRAAYFVNFLLTKKNL